VEELAIERCSKVFGAKHAIVQALSGAPANMAVYLALLQSGITEFATAPDGTQTPSPNYNAFPADKVLAMNLADGGHLTHGLYLNFSGRFYDFRHYGVNEKGYVDCDQIEEMARTLHPRMIIIGASAYPREYDYERIRKICDEAESKPYFMVDMSHYVGLVAAGLLKNPLDYGADVVTSTTHKTLGGPRGAIILTNDEEIYSKIRTALFPGLQGGAHFNNIASIAYVLGWAQTDEFKSFQKKIQDNAGVLAAELLNLGITPLSGGTDTHLVLIDLRPLAFTTKKGKPLSGRQASEALEQSGLIINRNAVPKDDKKPWITSGIRMGTSVLTARGMGPSEMKAIAGLVHKVLSNYGDEKVYDEVLKDVLKLTDTFPIKA
jgi:glycine hydroxymethyltransferase